MPIPRMTRGQKKSEVPDSSVELESIYVKTKKRKNPPVAMNWPGTPLFNITPTKGMSMMVAIPLGKRMIPVCWAEKPRRFWQNTGNMNTEPYNAKPRTKEVTMPMAKLLFFNIRKFTTGWSVLSSLQMKAMPDNMVVRASTEI